nr:MAG TPA: hypothetical protein [Caudoviricetes sp.]
MSHVVNPIYEKNITNAVRILSCNVLRVVTSPHSLNPPMSGFCRFWAWLFVGLGLSRSYPLTRLL